MISLEPVAYFHCKFNEKADLPRQGVLSSGNVGEICFIPGKNFEQALEDLEGIERIWVVFWMDQVKGWKAKVQPPRSVTKKGVFATRSPNRPNPIGLSCVKLLSVKGLKLLVGDHDLIDGSPILDIKPYLEYADSFPGSQKGWMEGLPPLSCNQILWNELSSSQISFLKEKGSCDLSSKIEARLQTFLEPTSSNRVKDLGRDHYLIAYQTWRVLFKKESAEEILILAVFSGYDQETLEGKKESRWDDLSLHRRFLLEFQDFLLYSHFKQIKGE